MLRYFENGEDVPFAVEFRDDNPEITCSDEAGVKVFKINPDSSLKRASGPRVGVWVARARPISKAWAMELARREANIP